MTMKRWIAAVLMAFAATTAHAQTTYNPALRVGGNPGSGAPSGSSMRITGTGARTGGQGVLGIDASGNVMSGSLFKADLPGAIAYEDEANTFTLGQQINSTLGVTGLSTLTGGFASGAASSVNGNLSLLGASDFILTSGGIRTSSGSVDIRNVADTANIATFGDSAIALLQNTAVTGTFSVSSTSTFTGLATFGGNVRATASPFTIRNDTNAGNIATFGNSAIALLQNTSVTGTFGASGNATFDLDVAVNGGDLTSTASTLNINSGGIINMQDRLTMSSANSAGADNWASWTTGWNCSYAGSCDMRHLQADELHVRLFIAELQEAHNGAEVWVKSTAILDQAFACPASAGTVSIRVRDFPSAANMRVFSNGDYVLFRPMSRTDADADGATDLVISECVGTVSAYVDGTAGTEGTQQWTFTRGTIGSTGGSMTAATNVPAENLALDFGVSGGGFLEATVNDGAEGVNGPYFQSVKWTGSPASANGTKTVTSRFGKLTGITTTADEYGFIAGIYGATSTGQYVKASNLGVDLHGVDFTMWDGSNQAIILRRGSGSAPYFGLGNPAPTTYASGSGVWMGDDGGTYKFRAGNPSARWFSIDDTNGLEFKNTTTSWAQFNASGLRLGVAVAGNGNILADTSGNMVFRSGTVPRMQFTAGNGTVQLFDDDGSTPRVYIDTTAAYFGGTTGARFQVDYGAQLRAFDGAGKQYMQVDATNGVLIGDWYSGGSTGYVQMNYRYFRMCANGIGACTLEFDGASGNITSAGSILLSAGGNVTSSGNWELNSTNGLLFSASTVATGTTNRMVQWANGSRVFEYANSLYLYSGAPGSLDPMYLTASLVSLPHVTTVGSSTGSTTLSPTGTGVGTNHFLGGNGYQSWTRFSFDAPSTGLGVSAPDSGFLVTNGASIERYTGGLDMDMTYTYGIYLCSIRIRNGVMTEFLGCV